MAWKTFVDFAALQLLLGVASGAAIDQQLLGKGSPEFSRLRAAFGERFVDVTPVASSCYSQPGPFDQRKCDSVEKTKTNDLWLADQPGGYFYSNWASCQATGEFCTLPLNSTTNPPSNATCYNGSLPNFMIDVRSVEDIRNAFKKAKEDNIPVIIKNTGHDWKGRSAAPGRTLAMWTHNFRTPKSYDENFKRTGCNDAKSEKVFHFGAGETWGSAYTFAHSKNMSILGGTCGSVGLAGWLHGGGHSPLTPVYGMGADNVRELEIVTPDGELRVANECTNPDLFFAVRGGGGGTWGVVTKITYKALEPFKVQEFSANFTKLSPDDIREFINILTTNAVAWSKTGWGGYIKPNNPSENIELINAHYTDLEAAKKEMAPIVEFLEKRNQSYRFVTRDSWFDYFVANLQPPDKHVGGYSATVASRLVPEEVFDTSRGKLSNTLYDLYGKNLSMWIMLVAPTMFEHTKTSALHPTWGTSLWSVRINAKWDQYWDEPKNVTVNRDRFQTVHLAMNPLRDITPGAGVSMSEADVWEEQHELTFWGGENYERLKKIKAEVDPANVMSNWMAVGYNSSAARYDCYPKL